MSQQAVHPNATLQRLDAFTGKWKSEGETVATDTEPSIKISGTDSYEWLPGGFFMIHHVDVRMGEEQVNVIEMIGGHDSGDSSLPMRSFDHQGNFSVMHATVDDHGVWTFSDEFSRATLTFGDDGSTMQAHWERRDERSDWQPWMEMRFTKMG